MLTRTGRATGETRLVPAGNRRSRVGPKTGGDGKWVADERVADVRSAALRRGSARGAKSPRCRRFSDRKGGKDGVTKTSKSLQDLRTRIFLKAKADRNWRFRRLCVHACKTDKLSEACEMARPNGGAPDIDSVTFETIEEAGREACLDRIQVELVTWTYLPSRNRQVEIPKDGGKVRTLGIPTSGTEWCRER
ncbi:MAG: hypothetical protein OXI01_14240 [Albidovulum sp.]|nr:hypothetical protein [Albidovulum sp.]